MTLEEERIKYGYSFSKYSTGNLLEWKKNIEENIRLHNKSITAASIYQIITCELMSRGVFMGSIIPEDTFKKLHKELNEALTKKEEE